MTEANDKLKQEADGHNKMKKQNAELSLGVAGREHSLAELQEKVAALQRARDVLEAESAALQVICHPFPTTKNKYDWLKL